MSFLVHHYSIGTYSVFNIFTAVLAVQDQGPQGSLFMAVSDWCVTYFVLIVLFAGALLCILFSFLASAYVSTVFLKA